jgi:GDP-4-dehydro-6-deoxy-D-mannose reductase
MKRLLVTGLSGFVGRTLKSSFSQTQAASELVLCETPDDYDLRNAGSVADLVREHSPDAVIHLAAQSHVMASIEDPATTLQINTVGTANLLKALSDSGFAGRLLYVSSADIYGSVDEALLPVPETQPAAPRNPYAVSKVAAELLCLQWARAYGLRAVIARPFNHTGTGQRPEFAISGFARDAVAIARGLQPDRLLVGDLDVTRDYLDVRDVVDAYFRLLDRGEAGQIYNVCSGHEQRMGDVLQMVLDCAGVRADLVADPARMRPVEQRRMCGNNVKIIAATGWRPKYSLRQTLQQLIDYWDKELQK